MRINKFLTDQGYCSRRKADELIEQGKVTVNDRKALLGEQVDPEKDIVKVDGEVIKRQLKRVYLMYNKPRGVICTTDPREKDNIIKAVNYSQRVFPIGRLDKDSTGLIFLTNDGDIVNQILRAQFGHEKEYVVNIDKPFDGKFLKAMGSGVDIGDHFTRPAKVESINRSTFSIVLTEGKNRQIRRMCEALGYKVRHLHRVRIMNVKLGSLKEGTHQSISPHDLNQLKKMIEMKSEDGRTNVIDVEE